MSKTLLDLGVGFVALAEDGLEGIKAVLDAQHHVRTPLLYLSLPFNASLPSLSACLVLSLSLFSSVNLAYPC